jgi:hypothetical protein
MKIFFECTGKCALPGTYSRYSIPEMLWGHWGVPLLTEATPQKPTRSVHTVENVLHVACVLFQDCRKPQEDRG